MAKVIWTEPALDDLDAIAGHIALDKVGAAKRLVRQVFVRVEQLAVFPQSGGKPRELSGTPYRQMVVPPLRIFYRVEAEKVYIVYVMRSERRFSFSDISTREH
jgi:toxin ParE1/3/4